jgi:hypothetical protein
MASSMSNTNGGGTTTNGGGTTTNGGGTTTNGGGTTTNGSTGSGASVTSLTSGLKQIQQSGPADLKLSTTTRDSYLNAISTFRTALQTQQTAMTNLGSLGSPGSLGSAVQTKNNLNLDVTGMNGIETAMSQYLTYLDEFETTVKKASDRLIQSG